MQVALLRRTLPAAARVGTVDKFQGQEVAVVLFSMATSSGEELPRNIEFLFSKKSAQRGPVPRAVLGVVSREPRAAGSRLQDAWTDRLVNTLCWIAGDYATGNLNTGTSGRSPGNVR